MPDRNRRKGRSLKGHERTSRLQGSRCRFAQKEHREYSSELRNALPSCLRTLLRTPTAIALRAKTTARYLLDIYCLVLATSQRWGGCQATQYPPLRGAWGARSQHPSLGGTWLLRGAWSRYPSLRRTGVLGHSIPLQMQGCHVTVYHFKDRGATSQYTSLNTAQEDARVSSFDAAESSSPNEPMDWPSAASFDSKSSCGSKGKGSNISDQQANGGIYQIKRQKEEYIRSRPPSLRPSSEQIYQNMGNIRSRPPSLGVHWGSKVNGKR